MDPQLQLLKEKLESLPLKPSEKAKYLAELSLRLRAKLLDTIYAHSGVTERKILDILSEKLDIEQYWKFMQVTLQRKELLVELQKTFTLAIEQELQQFASK